MQQIQQTRSRPDEGPFSTLQLGSGETVPSYERPCYIRLLSHILSLPDEIDSRGTLIKNMPYFIITG